MAAAFLCAGCATEAGLTPIGAATFGASVHANDLAQYASLRGGAHLTEMSSRFAAEAGDTALFAFNKAGLSKDARAALSAQAAWLKRHPDVRVRVVGHTDLAGGESYNQKLGLRRARAATRFLIAQGVARGRIDAVESRGETEPVVNVDGKERRNRRTVTEVAGFTHGFIGDGLDGRRAGLMYERYREDAVEDPADAVSTE